MENTSMFRSRHCWVNFYGGEWDTAANISFVFPFSPIAMTFQKREKYTLKNAGLF